MNAILASLKALGAPKLAAMGLVAAGLLGLLALLALRTPGSGPMALLYGDLDLKEAAQMADALERAHIGHESASGGSTLLVPASQVAQARLLLARDGLPSGGTIGYELLDHADGLMTSAAQQDVNRLRALEGELVRSIRTMRGVASARVHLVLPVREPFARDRPPPQASVLLVMAGNAVLDQEGVAAIQNLVAAAVAGLRPHGVSVVDSRGDVLARASAPDDPAVAAATLDELRLSTERRLAGAVEALLAESLGPGHVRATASAEFDYDQVHETQDRYDPDGRVERSTQNVTQADKTTEPPTTVSVQNNLPNADAGSPGGGSQTQRTEETTNYEIGHTVRTTAREQPRLHRVSLAVMVDGVIGTDGVWAERSPDELARIGRLAQTAIGFDAQRGDRVEVVSMKFAADAAHGAPEPHGLLGLGLGQADLLRLGQTGMLALTVLLAMVFVLRPMVLRLSPAPTGQAGGELGHAADGLGTGTLLVGMERGGPQLAAGRRGQAALPAPAGDTIEDDSMVDIAHVEGQLRAASIRRVADLVERHPEETLGLLRGWMQADHR